MAIVSWPMCSSARPPPGCSTISVCPSCCCGHDKGFTDESEFESEHETTRLALQHRAAHQVPTCLVRSVDQPTSQVGRKIRCPIEMRAISARLPMQKPSRCVVPGHQPVVEKHVAVATRSHAI